MGRGGVDWVLDTCVTWLTTDPGWAAPWGWHGLKCAPPPRERASAGEAVDAYAVGRMPNERESPEPQPELPRELDAGRPLMGPRSAFFVPPSVNENRTG
jgi:hypothetical protein